MDVDRLASIQELKQRLAEARTDAARLAVLRDLQDRSAELPPDEIEAYARQAVEFARKTRSYNDLVRAAITLSGVCQDAGDADAYTKCADIVHEAARASGNPVHEGQHQFLLGRAHEAQGNYELAQGCFERCLALFRNTGYADCVGAALNQLANLAALRGRAAEALEYYQECLKLDDDLGDVTNGALHQYNIGFTLQRVGRLDDAFESYYRTLALSEQHPEVSHMRPVALNSLAELFLERDKAAKAIGILRMLMGTAEPNEVPSRELSDAMASLGLAHHRQGDRASAHQAYTRSLALAGESGHHVTATIVLWRMAELALDMCQFDRCRELAERAAVSARRLGLPCEEAQALRVTAMMHAARGEDEKAHECFEQAMELLCGLEESLDMARVRFHYGRYLLTRSEREAAMVHLKASSRAFRKLGITAEGHEVNRLIFEHDMHNDGDTALLQGISGLAALGVEPKMLLERAIGLLLVALRFDSAAVIARGRPVLTLGNPDLTRALAVNPSEGMVFTDVVLSWPLRCGETSHGRIYLERAVPVVTEYSPLVLDAIANLLAPSIQRLADLAAGVVEGRPELAGLRYQGVVSRNQRMLEVLATVCAEADKSGPVLIRGESGTGKELIARALHDSGVRAGRPFVAVNCAALPDDLLEVECFGIEESAATGAKARKGRLEAANGGTLFLDGIGDMSRALQVKLLRVLQEKTFERVGGSIPIKVDVRVVAATKEPLAELVAQRWFREDLCDRLSGVELLLPSLNDRVEDIPDLVRHFVRCSNQEFRRNVANVSQEVMSRLTTHRWLDNVRELEQVIERAVLLARGDTIQLCDLPPGLQ